MPVIAITPNYKGLVRDRVENFGGNILLFVNWEGHLRFVSPVAFPISPDVTFSTLFSENLPGCYNTHPDWEKIDSSKIIWTLNGAPFTPQPEKALKDQGFDHKSLLIFETPGLKGIAGASF